MISINEINKNDIVSLKVEDIQEFSDGTKAYKLGDFYVSGDVLNKMIATSVISRASIDAVNTYSPFDRGELGDEYYFIDADGEVEVFEDVDTPDEEALHEVANYCTDKELIKQRAMHEVLNRLLWRYGEERGGSGDWETPNNHWFIYKDMYTGIINSTYSVYTREPGTVYFTSEAIANKAITDIVRPFIENHPNFEW